MGEKSLASRIGQPTVHAAELLRLHHKIYSVFWRWSDGALDFAILTGRLWTVFRWTVRAVLDPNPRFLRNFLMQASGAEMLRIACFLAIERGVRICAPVHDAILIEAPQYGLDEAAASAQKAMSDASCTVLGGFRLSSEAKIVRYPNRYMDERGVEMWRTVWAVLERFGVRTGAPAHT
jgi:hypothetical protein